MACWRRNRDIARYLFFGRYQGKSTHCADAAFL